MAVTTAVEFFGPANGITVPECWKFQNGGDKNDTKTRASELGADGDEIFSKLHDARETTSFSYVLNVETGTVAFPAVGAISNGWHIDGFSCAWSRDQARPKLTVNCHRHTGSKTHAEGACRTYTPSLAAIAAQAFGCPTSFGDAFALATGTAVDLRSATYAVNCTHNDELGSSGDWLSGNNNDGVETLAVELTGAATSDDYTSSWDRVSNATTPSNTGATSSSFNFEHHLAHDAT